MTSSKDFSYFTTSLALGISVLSLTGITVHAQIPSDLQLRQNQLEIDRLRQQLDAQNNGIPQRGMSPNNAAPMSGSAFGAQNNGIPQRGMSPNNAAPMSGSAFGAQNNGIPQRGMSPNNATPRSSSSIDARSIQRSVNLARDTAIRINGGLSRYRPAGCMFRGSNRNPCIARSGPQGILFEIPGGPPGWEESRALPSIMTVLLISPDGRSLLQTISNAALSVQQPNPNNYPYQPGSYPQR